MRQGKADDVTAFGTEAAFQEVFSTEDSADPLALFESEGEPGRTSGGAVHQPPAGSAIETPAVISKFAPAAAPSPRSGAAAEPTMLAQERYPAQERAPIALDQVLGRLGHVAWVEAVAVIEALCAALSDATRGDARVPDLSHISMTARGAIVAGAGVQGSPGPRLARTLHALTAAGAIPVPLRLFITKWISFADAHSIPDFAKELAYFARPDGAALIQAVYDRAAAAPPALTKPQAVEPEKAPPADKPRARRARRSRWLAAAAIVLGGAVLAGGLMWRERSTPSEPSDQASTFTVATLLSGTADMARRVVAGVSERAGMSPAEPEPRAQGGPSAPARNPARTARAAAGPGSGTRGASPRPSAGSPDAGLSLGARGGSSPDPTLSLVAPRTPSGASVGADAAVERNDLADVSDVSIYSSADPDVLPPEMLQPHLPAPLLSGVRAEVNTIELIISARGTVERVRLFSQPRRMADMMLLSGAKTWSFKPASKHGQSVRYRLLLSWDATP